MRKVIAFFLLAILVLPLFAFYRTDTTFSGDGEVIPIGSEMYEDFDNLFVLAGKPRPSSSRPWTVSEAKFELSKIDPSRLSGHALTLYNQISSSILGGKSPEIAVEVSLSPEVYFHTNDDFCLEEDWNYGYTRRNPILYLGLNAWQGGFALHTELTVGNGLAGNGDDFQPLGERAADNGMPFEGVGDVENEYGIQGGNLEAIEVVKRSSVYSSLFSFNALGHTDNEVPRNSTITFGGENSSFGFYKSQKTWGYNRIGNFIFDSHIERYTYLTYKNFNSKFSFESTIMFPEAFLGGNHDTIEYGNKRRLFLAHRFDIPVGEKMKLAISENVMYLATNFFDMQFINPATIYHNNLNSSQFNAIAHIEFEYVPAPGLSFYAQIAVDQGTVPIFEKTHEDQAVGVSVGTVYAIDFVDSMALLNFEMLYAAPALYRRDAPDFIITNSSQISDGYRSIPYFTYIGLEYGGDTLGFRLDGEYKTSCFKTYLGQTVILKGGFDLYQKYTPASFVGEFLSGNISLVSITELGAEYAFDLWKTNCSAFADMSLIYRKKEFDCQVSIGLKASLSTRKK